MGGCGSCWKGECWHVVITVPKCGEKLNLQTTAKTQKSPLFGTGCQYPVAWLAME